MGASLEPRLVDSLAGGLTDEFVFRLVGTLEFLLDALVSSLVDTLACT